MSIYDSVSPKELVKMALEHKETPRTPYSLGFGVNLPVRLQLMEYLGHSGLTQTDAFLLGFDDIRRVGPPYIGPPGRNRVMPDGRIVDVWGVIREPVTYAEDGVYNEICHYPLAGVTNTAGLEAYDWPNPDWFDYSAIPDIIREANPDGRYAVMMGNGNIFETAWYMRGFEQALLDLMLEPELMDAIFSRVAAFYETYFDRALAAARGAIDLAFTADDIAGQNGMLFSPELWKAHIKPWHKKLNKLLHGHGVKILYHTDGAAHSVMEDLIDMGIDCWEAFQLDARGMDAGALKDAAAGRLAFHGGISVQQLLPFASADEVGAEVSALILRLGKGGGYIAAPSHAVQAGTPPENVVAMLKAARPDIVL